jgi:hypothetical protein
MNDTTSQRWWGEFDLPLGSSRGWDIGPLTLALSHLAEEWRLDVERRATVSADDPERVMPTSADENARFLTSAASGRLALRPRLADRPFAVRPRTAFQLLAGDEITLFVSTPVWVEIRLLEPERPIAELPVLRPSDSWFGADTMQGELCYATRTSARLSLDEQPALSHRAITPLILRNRASSALSIERLLLPVPQLALYTDGDGRLWTTSATLTREADAQHAEFGISDTPPEQARSAQRLAEPRTARSRSFALRAWSSLFR